MNHAMNPDVQKVEDRMAGLGHLTKVRDNTAHPGLAVVECVECRRGLWLRDSGPPNTLTLDPYAPCSGGRP